MKLIQIGKIVNTHGIKGELRLLSKFPYKDKVFKKNVEIYINKENKEIINSYRKHKNFDMITLDGYSNIKEDILLDENNYLDEEIIGLNVIYNNENKGIVKNIERYDKTTLLIVKYEDKEYLLPYNNDIIEKIDINNDKIYIKNIKGLF